MAVELGCLGCNRLSGKQENVDVMTRAGSRVAVTWDGLCLSERQEANTRPFRSATCLPAH